MQIMQQHLKKKTEILKDHLRSHLRRQRQKMIHQSQVVVAGSMELFTDSTDQIVSGSNVSMFTDIMTNLTGGEDDNTSVIPVKDYKMSTITITSISTIIGGLAASIFIPVVLIIIGVVIWAVRRKK